MYNCIRCGYSNPTLENLKRHLNQNCLPIITNVSKKDCLRASNDSLFSNGILIKEIINLKTKKQQETCKRKRDYETCCNYLKKVRC